MYWPNKQKRSIHHKSSPRFRHICYLSLLPSPVTSNTRSGTAIISHLSKQNILLLGSPYRQFSLCATFRSTFLRDNLDQIHLLHKNFQGIPPTFSIQSKLFILKFNILYNLVPSSFLDQSPTTSLQTPSALARLDEVPFSDHILSASNELLCFSLMSLTSTDSVLFSGIQNATFFQMVF